MSTPNPNPVGSALNPIINPTAFSWIEPTANEPPTAGGTPPPFDATAEVTGYLIGIRAIAGTSPGTYAIQSAVTGATTLTETLAAAVGGPLAPGNYAAAIQTVGPEDSPWSDEIFFDIVVPLPVPLPPSGFSAA